MTGKSRIEQAGVLDLEIVLPKLIEYASGLKKDIFYGYTTVRAYLKKNSSQE